jgi:hypothetical protein
MSETPVAPLSRPPAEHPTHDSGARRKSVRRRRERGCSLYVTAHELWAAGYRGEGPPLYKVWPGHANRRTLLIQLYEEA